MWSFKLRRLFCLFGVILLFTTTHRLFWIKITNSNAPTKSSSKFEQQQQQQQRQRQRQQNDKQTRSMEDLASKNHDNTTTSTQTIENLSCFEPNLENTLRLVQKYKSHRIPLPVFNMGMPKIGSTTLQVFFKCAGLNARGGQEGTCFRDAAAKGKPVLETCRHSPRPLEAWTQMDSNLPPNHCYYPQISNLWEIHNEAPNATFILNFRPFADWFSSLMRWHSLRGRLKNCDLPGLPKGAGTQKDFEQWLCGHVQNIRQFVQKHASHELIELDLYSLESRHIMAQLFHTNASCWGHVNANPSRQQSSSNSIHTRKKNKLLLNQTQHIAAVTAVSPASREAQNWRHKKIKRINAKALEALRQRHQAAVMVMAAAAPSKTRTS